MVSYCGAAAFSTVIECQVSIYCYVISGHFSLTQRHLNFICTIEFDFIRTA